MQRITETQLQILEELHIYRFLTAQQMQEIGIAKTKYTLSRNISAIQKQTKPLVQFIDFGTFPTVGRLPRLYYLTKHGAQWLAEAFRVDPNEINAPKGVKVFSRDYFHRVATINTHIHARNFAQKYNLEFDFFHTYFEHTGANNSKQKNQAKRQALTKIFIDEENYFIPDSILQLTDPQGKKWIFTAEIYRNHTTKRTHNQLKKHRQALEEGSITIAYEYDRAVRVLMICEDENAMKSLMKRTAQDADFNGYENFILFNTLDGIQQNFAGNWYSYTGKLKNIFVV